MDANPAGLYLASKSPRRRELLSQIGVNYQVLPVDVPELHQPHEAPAEYVQRLATEKARAGMLCLVAAGTEVAATVMGADTVVVLDDQILEKPANAAEGQQMLLTLSGRQHQVMTAVSLCRQDEMQITRLSVTDVSFRDISADEAARYWQTGEPCDKAGGYGIQGLGAVFVTSIRGSYSGVVGLPIEVVVPMLEEFNVPYWQA